MISLILQHFTDPVLRAPTIGCMLMCFAAALVGVIVFLKKQSLLGETLSHSAYPGVIVGIIFAGALSISDDEETKVALFIMTGAFVSTIFGMLSITFFERKLSIRSDSALCFVLSSFFGIGLTLASEVQFAYTSLYRQVQVYLYGQAATMTDIHILIYGILSAIIVLVIVLFYKEIQTISFDQDYARSLGVNTSLVDTIVFVLIVLAVVIGIRSVGVVLMSAMLIAPAVAARQFTNRLSIMFFLAGVFGLLSGFFGNFFSVEFTNQLALKYPRARLSLPSGPMIVIVASIFCVLSLMFAPKRGFLLRLARIAKFRYQCIGENLLKAIWRYGPNQHVSFTDIERYQSVSPLYLKFILMRLKNQGWVELDTFGLYQLTEEGRIRAAHIVRLHRLWEVYLVDYLGVGSERVHRSAEEMEHIITPELEGELTLLLRDPKRDPHHQPIPPKEI